HARCGNGQPSPAQQAFWCIVSFPDTGNLFVCLGQGWIGMNSAGRFVKADNVLVCWKSLMAIVRLGDSSTPISSSP
ncbi:MAG: hypothetical protein PHD43_07075, partial [Methylococcales bacterium]|nr:hypothetical protein [Methylococcales bacterium]